MRKKYTLSLLIITGLSFSGTMIGVFGQMSYTCELKVGDQVILELIEVDKHHSIMWGEEIGDQRKYEVISVTEETYSFQIQIGIWNIAANETFSNHSDSLLTFNVTKDPTKLSSLQVSILSPINSYLTEFVEGKPNFTVNKNTIVWDDWPEIHYHTYDSNGFISEFKLINNTDLLHHWVKPQPPGIPGYDLSIMIGLTTIAVLSLVYIWKKKRLT